MKFDTQGWYLDRGRWGSLDGIVIAPRSGPPSMLVTLCHGFGAPGTDLVSLVEDLVPRLADDMPAPAFLFPEGPIDLAETYGMPGASAWWPLNMAMLAELAQADSFDVLRNEIPAGIDSARERLTESILQCAASHDWTDVPNVLGGFSQGAMLAVDAALRSPTLQAQGVIVWSGALICEGAWRSAHAERAMPSHAEHAVPVRAYQSHGRQDPILPIGTGRALHQFLKELGWQIESEEFDGPHTIPGSGLAGAAQLIELTVRSTRI